MERRDTDASDGVPRPPDDLTTVSFFGANIHPLVVEYQRRVFEHLRRPHHIQVPIEGVDGGPITATRHGECIDEFLTSSDWEHVAIFDIDAIPLLANWSYYYDADAITGGAHWASHLPGSTVYASPAWVMFSRRVWEELDRPSFVPTDTGDTGETVSRRAREAGKRVSILWASSYDQVLDRWSLDEDLPGGLGVTWGGVVYHATGSRFYGRSTLRFMQRARRVLGLPADGLDTLEFRANWAVARGRELPRLIARNRARAQRREPSG